MNLIDLSIRKPVGVAVVVILVVLFGLLTFFQIPIQLTPDVDQPRITVETVWRGASPQEVEREIVDRQEEQLKSVDGLVEMTSESQDSLGSVVLEFPIGTDIDAASLKVSNKLEEVQEQPELAEEPTISNVDSRDGAIAWLILQRLEGNEQEINTYRDLCEDVIKPAFERIPGVARVNIFGGTERSLTVLIDPAKLSAHRLTVPDVVRALQSENRNISAGDFDEGKRRFIVRTIGEFQSPKEIEDLVVAQEAGRFVYLRDVGEAFLDYKEADFTVRRLGYPSIAMNCQRAAGANVLEVMKGIQSTLEEINEDVLGPRQLELNQVYDETIYIYSALSLVQQNIFIGGLLALTVLYLFLRSRSSLLIIAVAIPISIIGTFLMMFVLGRNINVISLAGMSFAVGMVVDNSIVVLENIFRHRQMGKSRTESALQGAREVWGAVLASTLTTAAVFIPILFIEDEIGQLYRDIALAISSAVVLSLLAAITVIPSLASRVMGQHQDHLHDSEKSKSSPGRIKRWIHRVPLFRPEAREDQPFARAVSGFVYRLNQRIWTRIAVIVGLTAASIGLSLALLPPAEYLPEGNRNLVFGILLPPPGYNLEELTRIGKQIEQDLSPYFPELEGEVNEDIQDPEFEHFFFVARGRNVFMGARAQDASEVDKLLPVMQKPLQDIPGMIAIVTKSSLFGRSIGQGRNIDLEITGPELEVLLQIAGQTFGQLMGMFPDAQMRPIPSLDLGNPEIAIDPDREALARLKLTTRDLGETVDVFLDGREVDGYKFQGEELDLVLEGLEQYASNTEDFANLPVIAPNGERVTLGSIADIQITSGPEQINHIERRRAITINIVPPAEQPLETVMNRIDAEVIQPLQDKGTLGQLYQMNMAGTADDLAVTFNALKWTFLLALVISYLLMSALFDSFLYPLVILFSVPLAAVGGFIGLRTVNVFILQPMDTLTMLGFIILIGTVVNNAILIVHQSLNHIRDEDMGLMDAVRESVRTRIRPIFMSTTTTVLGMLPLVVFPGAGSELYRGIGSVVIGGLIFATIFTLFLVPALFSLVYEMRERTLAWVRRFQGETA